MKHLALTIACGALVVAASGCGGGNAQEEHNKNLKSVTATGGLKQTPMAGADSGGKGKNQGNAPKATTPP